MTSELGVDSSMSFHLTKVACDKTAERIHIAIAAVRNDLARIHRRISESRVIKATVRRRHKLSVGSSITGYTMSPQNAPADVLSSLATAALQAEPTFSSAGPTTHRGHGQEEVLRRRLEPDLGAGRPREGYQSAEGESAQTGNVPGFIASPGRRSRRMRPTPSLSLVTNVCRATPVGIRHVTPVCVTCARASMTSPSTSPSPETS